MKRVLVTGVGGFIGSHLCEALVTKGYKVRAMIRYNCGFFSDMARFQELGISG